MDHRDHVSLIRSGIPVEGGAWADFGSGDGAFTLALADVLGGRGSITSVDRDGRALETQRKRMTRYFPDAVVTYHGADFQKSMNFLPLLDGILMANSLHFVSEKEPLVRRLRTYLKPEGRLVLVEYDTDRGNRWVPFPLSFASWQVLAAACGFARTELLATQPSRFLGRFFSALSL